MNDDMDDNTRIQACSGYVLLTFLLYIIAIYYDATAHRERGSEDSERCDASFGPKYVLQLVYFLQSDYVCGDETTTTNGRHHHHTRQTQMLPLDSRAAYIFSLLKKLY